VPAVRREGHILEMAGVEAHVQHHFPRARLPGPEELPGGCSDVAPTRPDRDGRHRRRRADQLAGRPVRPCFQQPDPKAPQPFPPVTPQSPGAPGHGQAPAVGAECQGCATLSPAEQFTRHRVPGRGFPAVQAGSCLFGVLLGGGRSRQDPPVRAESERPDIPPDGEPVLPAPLAVQHDHFAESGAGQPATVGRKGQCGQVSVTATDHTAAAADQVPPQHLVAAGHRRQLLAVGREHHRPDGLTGAVGFEDLHTLSSSVEIAFLTPARPLQASGEA
jgi:hypothetical protein